MSQNANDLKDWKIIRIYYERCMGDWS